MRRGLALMMGMLATLPREDPPVVVPSHKIEPKRENQQLSKHRLQRMKGKKARQ